jgi:3-hydroxybutyryl-CoA dehydratase
MTSAPTPSAPHTGKREPHRLSEGRYGFDDVTRGDSIETGRVTVTAAIIDRFAELTGDRFEIHMTLEGARRHGFSERVAHGLLVLSLVDGLKNQCPAQFHALASLGWDWSFRRPVLAGDTIGATITVREKRPTGKPDRGILTLDFDVTNQSGETVQRGTNQLMAYR